MPVNRRILRIEVLRQAGGPKLVREVRPYVEADFESKKEIFMDGFDSDPITRELEKGSYARSSIPEIAAGAGGNLFSLLGFEDGQDPIEPLREYLDKNIKLGRTRGGVVKNDRIIFETPITIPSIKDIDAAMAKNNDTKLEWDGRAFTYLIRNGIPWFFAYLYDETRNFESSRSGPAIQAKKGGKLVKVRDGQAPSAEYLTDLLDRLKRSISFRK